MCVGEEKNENRGGESDRKDRNRGAFSVGRLAVVDKSDRKERDRAPEANRRKETESKQIEVSVVRRKAREKRGGGEKHTKDRDQASRHVSFVEQRGEVQEEQNS